LTKRYFYTDPLAAAWMAKQFGMTFQQRALVPRGPDGSIDGGDFFECHAAWQDWQIDSPLHSRYFINPDSLHLLEPKIGDLVELHYLVSGTFHCVSVGAHMIHSLESDTETVNRIIQRNGVAFMWPESEGM
jgi:hypothetical protein